MATTTTPILGQEINIWLKPADSTGSYLKVGCAVNTTFSVSREMIEARCKDLDANFATKAPGTGSYEVTTDGLVIFSNVVNPKVLFDWMKDKILLDFRISNENPGDTEIIGQGYITEFEQVQNNDEFATYAFTLQGTGEPDINVIV